MMCFVPFIVQMYPEGIFNNIGYTDDTVVFADLQQLMNKITETSQR